MNIYEREAIGSIIVVKNVIFENAITNKSEYDHSWDSGRPCLIIFSDEEYDYFLTLSSSEKSSKFDNQKFKLTDDNLLYKTYNRRNVHNSKNNRKKGIRGAVNLQKVYKMPVSGHDELCKIDFETYKDVIDKLKKYHKNISLEEILLESKMIGKTR